MDQSDSRTETGSSRSACALLALVVVLLAACTQAQAWISTVPGELGIDDAAREIARDPGGDLLAVANTVEATTVEKYAGNDGRRLWRVDDASLRGSARRSLATDPRGDALVVFDSGDRLVVAKRAGEDGHEIWRHASQAGLKSTLPPLVDAAGNVLVVGALGNDLGVLKLDGTSGSRLWLARLPSAARHVATAAAIDPSGDVAVAGHLDDGLDTQSIVTRVAGADGRRLWSAVLDGSSRLAGIGFDAAGDVLVGGDRRRGIDQPLVFLVAKLAGGSGSVHWRDLSVIGASAAFAVDAVGGIVLAGSDGEPGDRPDVVVARWDPDGSPAWRRIVPPPDGASHQTRHLAIASDTVTVGGAVQIGDSRSGFFVLGFAAADGATRWRVQRDGDGNLVFGFDVGGTDRLVAGAGASVLVAASVGDEGSLGDVVLAKIAARDGRELWRTDVRETTSNIYDAASSIALDQAGDLIAGGNIASATSGARVGAAKFSPTDGRLLWRTTIDGLYGDGHLQIDPAGDVVAAGSIRVGPPTLSDDVSVGRPAPVALTVVKLAGDDGSETWRWTDQGGEGFLTDPRTAIDGSGDVLVNAWVGYAPSQQVIKLDGERGAPRWIAPVGFPNVVSHSSPLVVDPSDDVIAAVNASAPPTGPSPRIVKLDGATGAVLWSAELQSDAVVLAMAVDSHGDVLLGGVHEYPGTRFVSKVVGATGSPIWSVELGPGWVEDVGLAPDGAVVVAGWEGTEITERRLAVTKLDGTIGDRRWTHLEPGETPGVASSVVVGAKGDVVVAGRLDVGYVAGFAVLALDGATGIPRWTRRLPPSAPAIGVEAHDLVLDGRGKVVAAGALLESLARLGDFAVVSLDAATGRDDGGACRFPRSCGDMRPRLSVPRPANGIIPRR